MNQSLLSEFGDPIARVEAALAALRAGQGVLVADDEDRENEGDLIFAAESMTNEQMAMMIRECSGIVCLCLTDERVRQLELPMMVEANSSHYQTAFTVTIEAAQGVTTGVSAADRITTIQAAIADGARPSDLHRPGHVFPLRADPTRSYRSHGGPDAAGRSQALRGVVRADQGRWLHGQVARSGGFWSPAPDAGADHRRSGAISSNAV